MEASDRMTESELESLRVSKLRDLLDYCGAHVPHMKRLWDRAGIAPSEIRTVADLAKLPVITKAEMRTGREELRSRIGGKLQQMATGGSTGEPLQFDLSKRRIASRVACRQRVSRWWGVSVGDPELAVWGSPVELSRQDWIRGVRDMCLATRLLRAFEMDAFTITRYLDIIERGRWRQIFGYPSAIYVLCLHAKKEGRRLRQLGIKAVFVTGEVLLPHQRELISETFNCPVADGYGGRDSGFIAHECPQGGMHSMADAVVVEILDSENRPVPAGEAGQIVITDLYSHEFPFIRYATGDWGAFSTRSCGCGRRLPLLDRIEGRANDAVIAADGRVINSLALIYPLREVGGIEQFRIVQKAVDRFHVQLVPNHDFRREAEEEIRSSWAKLLRSSIHVTFEYLQNALPVERSGKFRHVVSEIGTGQVLGSGPR
jgi:phenylacetate-CoA ligase